MRSIIRKSLLLAVVALIAVALLMINTVIPKQGYYVFEDHAYYCLNAKWYLYDEGDRWIALEAADEELEKQWQAYYAGLIYDQEVVPSIDFALSDHYAAYYRTNVYMGD